MSQPTNIKSSEPISISNHLLRVRVRLCSGFLSAFAYWGKMLTQSHSSELCRALSNFYWSSCKTCCVVCQGRCSNGCQQSNPLQELLRSWPCLIDNRERQLHQADDLVTTPIWSATKGGVWWCTRTVCDGKPWIPTVTKRKPLCRSWV